MIRSRLWFLVFLEVFRAVPDHERDEMTHNVKILNMFIYVPAQGTICGNPRFYRKPIQLFPVNV